MKPIIFNTSMVRAILDGRKTVTRRVVKFKDGQNPKWTGYVPDGDVLYGSNNIPAAKAPYKHGDILYVRETWGYDKNIWLYKADFSTADLDRIASITKWRPSIHMPKEAARIFLRVTNVRVERLQDIMDDPPGQNNQVVREGCKYGCDFIALWDSTIKEAEKSRYGWDANPWVWVIEFERISEEETMKGCE